MYSKPRTGMGIGTPRAFQIQKRKKKEERKTKDISE
jgi:hypothetical protein